MVGTVVRVIHSKNFGFIRTNDGEEYFFHKDNFTGFWQDLSKDHASGMEVQVSFDEDENSGKGPRAKHVMRVDFPNRGD